MGFGVIYFLFAIAAALVVLFVGSALLRGAVALANSTIGPVKTDEPIGWDWDAEEDDEDILPADAESALPEPGLGLGMRILFLAGAANLAAGLVLQVVLYEILEVRRGLDSGPGYVLAAAVGFLILSGVVAWLLPTTFRRAALAALFFYLILIAIGGLVAGLLFALFG